MPNESLWNALCGHIEEARRTYGEKLLFERYANERGGFLSLAIGSDTDENCVQRSYSPSDYGYETLRGLQIQAGKILRRQIIKKFRH